MKVTEAYRKLLSIPVVLVMALGMTAPTMADGHGKHHNSSMDKNIIDVAVSAGQFTTLAAALEAAGLVETLRGDGPFTVFAPTDAAFAKLPKGTVASLLLPENKKKLIAVLTYHVVPGKVLAEQVVTLNTAKTVNGDTLDIKVTNGMVTVDMANVIKTDIGASNGVIHVIDSVILPN